MSQLISLNLEDFQKLVRGEMITQGDLQVALHDIGPPADVQLPGGRAARNGLHLSSVTGRSPSRLSPWLRTRKRSASGSKAFNQSQPCDPGGFLHAFAAAVCRATDDNYPILRPALLALKAKFPKYRFSGVL
jgi:hypothetical protein